MDGDKLGMAFKMIKEYGLEGTLKFLLNLVPEPPSLVAVQERFHDIVRGDHLVYKTSMGWNLHFYVVDNLGGGSLKVCGYFLEGNDNLFIEEELIFQPTVAQQMKVEERILNEASIIQKLKKKVYQKSSNFHNEECRVDVFKNRMKDYDFLFNNSEHFINFVKTGQARCQIATDIESFIKKHIFVQAIQNCNIEMVRIVAIHSNWATIMGSLCVLVLQNSGIKLATQRSIQNMLIEAGMATTVKVIKNVAKSITKSAVTQATKMVVKEGGKVTVIQATKNVAKEVVKGGGKTAAVQTTKSAAKEVVKKGGKVGATGIATAVVQEVSKEVLEESGKAATNQATRSAAKIAVQQVSKEALKQGTKDTTLQVAKNAAANAVKQSAKGTVVAGLLIEGALYSFSMSRAIYKHSKGEMDKEELIDFAVEQTATSGGSAAGGISGSLAGAAAGAAIGSVVPGIGTVIGGAIGGITGGISGGLGGSLLGKGVGKLINFGRKK